MATDDSFLLDTPVSGATYSVEPGAIFPALLGGMPSEVGQHSPSYAPPGLTPAITPPTAPALTILALAGNLGIGQYRYAITYLTALGETQAGTEAIITTTAGSQQTQLTLPIGPAGTTGRRIYRTPLNGPVGAEQRVATITDNTTTTYTDDLADTGLGVGIPTTNQTGQLGVQIVPLAGGMAITPRDTWPIHEELPNSAIYSARLTAPTDTGDYAVLWDASNGSAPFWSQTLAVDTLIPVQPPSGQDLLPVYVQQADCSAYIPNLVIDDPTPGGLFDQLITRCELEIDSILGFWIRDPATGRKINMANIIPVAPISPFPGELFAPYQRGVTIYQKAALQNAVCAQVEYHLLMGEDFFKKSQFDQVSGPQFSRQGRQSYIAPKARQHLAQMGLVRRYGRMTI